MTIWGLFSIVALVVALVIAWRELRKYGVL